MADHIDTDAIRDEINHCEPWQWRAWVEDLLPEVDRLRDLLAKALQWNDPGRPVSDIGSDIDTDDIRANYCDGQKRANWQAYIFGDVGLLCDEVDRLRAENAALAAALADIAGMSPTYGKGTVDWVATAECSNMGTRCCWEYLGQPDGGADEWCPVCVAEVAWCAWRMGVLG